ncbi:hypothetical protein F4821DRAFT_273945 [Hypoxylon rubiginosum]|uniref:Uncharacterized protein n=1 Tax=Hypoxylon rubiginosum TaxID=110542 RepID=A0ACC0CIM0_9PEZI|nr:hypothetical protein F4821DRAFT_273945 [Hypoxylon rubiginosum]
MDIHNTNPEIGRLLVGCDNLTLRSGPVCNNDSDVNKPCKNSGKLACTNCLLVTYCGKTCQVAHWPTHRQDCKSSLMKKTWAPSWVTQNRTPEFMTGGPPQAVFGARKYLWGNVPAIDVIRMGQNEGVDFQGPINLLFAASGDIRNTILSIANLPPTYHGPLNVTINDREIDIVARNVIFLLAFFVEEDSITASEHVLHIWYSALLTEPCSSLLYRKLKPFIEDICIKIAKKPASTLLGKTWRFGESSLRLVLTRDSWFSLFRYFDVPQGLSRETAQYVRQGVVSAPKRIDYVDRQMCMMSPSARLGMAKFRQDGILLPFGQPRGAFTTPNPTMFQSSQWPMMDNADPVSGWSLKLLLEFDAGPASNDVYGKLYHYLNSLFTGFHCPLRSGRIAFDIFHVDARLLPGSLANNHFDRIDVGNICDNGYIGIESTLKTFGPLLQPSSINPHATLVTLFLNAVAEMRMMADNLTPFVPSPLTEGPREKMRKVLQYMPELGRQVPGLYHVNSIKRIAALNLLHDMDQHFNLYMDIEDFAEVGFVEWKLISGTAVEDVS